MRVHATLLVDYRVHSFRAFSHTHEKWLELDDGFYFQSASHEFNFLTPPRSQAGKETAAMAAASSTLLLHSALPGELLPSSTSTKRFSQSHGLSVSPACSRAIFSSSASGGRRKGHSGFNKVKLHRNAPRALFGSDRSSDDEGSDLPPPGCSRVKVELSRPLGIAFEETKIGTIVVDEVIKGGNAESSGLVEVGDQLIATSAVVYSDTDEYQGVTVRKGMQIVRLNVRGEKFQTVMAAIGTHPAYIKVTLELQKCEPLTTNGVARNGSLKE
ncbi:hypothetical protein R1flu_009014 [Riccia fluitans]|uniref:PDZ domain-containing protein n=1 Tax=Riccia fluitans TaxID=41844 RepID=A0ABD1Z0V5_9MARC